MRTSLLFAAASAVALTLIACGDSSTAPRLSPAKVSKDEITCRSGYHIATREDGTEVCEPDADLATAEPALVSPTLAAPAPIPVPPVTPPVDAVPVPLPPVAQVP